jgi:hypothetical protein
LDSNCRYDGFVGLAVRAIIGAQIRARFLRFDASKYQRPAAAGTGRPEIVDELKVKRVYHDTDSQRLYRPNSESIPHSKIGQGTCHAAWNGFRTGVLNTRAASKPGIAPSNNGLSPPPA